MPGWPRAPAMWSLPSSESLGPGLCQLSALKTGEHATKPSFKGSPQPPPKPSLAWPTPSLTRPPTDTHPQLLRRPQTGSEQEMQKEEGGRRGAGREPSGEGERKEGSRKTGR